VLRIEDTDRERLVEGAVGLIYKTLALAGLAHDEGPDVGGSCGPYVQSERKAIYEARAQELVSRGAAYYCFCTKERLAGLRAENEARGRTNLYDRRCLAVPPEEAEARRRAGEPCVVRQKMPQEGSTTFRDEVYGEITVDNAELEDQVLLKSDGLPTYNFANVVDDHLMGITHVVRGQEYLSSTPKYNLLYDAFGWPHPAYVHLPPVVKEGGRKISKREGDASFEDLVAMGYLPEALVNYIALLGWAPEGTREFFTLPELVGAFSLSGLSRSPSTFDFAKLRYFNAEYIRRMDPQAFRALAEPYVRRAVRDPRYDAGAIADTVQQRAETLEDIPGMVGFYDELPGYGVELFEHKKSKSTLGSAREALAAAEGLLAAAPAWDGPSLYAALSEAAQARGMKNSQLMWPLRVALSGLAVTPGGATDIAAILGRGESLRRVRLAIEKLA
jgi:glutamyl-tRNA synthetase